MNLRSLLLWSLCGLLVCQWVGSAQGNERVAVTTANWDLAARWTPDSIADSLFSIQVEPNWIGDGDRFWYRFETATGIRYWLVDPAGPTKRPLFDHEALAAALAHDTGEAHDATQLDLQDLEVDDDGTALRFTVGDKPYSYLPVSSRLEAIESEPEAPDWCTVSPDGERCVFGRGNNLFMQTVGAATIDEVQLTRDGQRGWAWGDPWELFENIDGEPQKVPVVWSPDSRFVAMQRADSRQVADYWTVKHLSEPRPILRTFKYPVPGETVPQWQVWVVDVGSATSVQVESDRWPDQTMEEFFINPLQWSDDSRTLFFFRRSRDYLKLDLCAGDPLTGKSKVLIEERLDGMVYAHPLVELSDGRLLWWSVRDGWGHYGVHEEDGTLVRRLTRGAFNAEDVVAADEVNDEVFLSANGREKGRNPYYQHFYRVNLDGSQMRLLTPEDADHSAVVSPSRGYFVDRYSRVEQPTRSVLRDAAGRLLLELEMADVSGLTDEGWRPPELFKALSADGITEQWGVMWKPFDFDPKRSYPIVTRVYPGRMEEYIPKRFRPVNVETTLAQLGCVVVRFGNRGGTRFRGLAYREYARDQFRDYGLADKLVVIEDLADRHGFIDRERVGIFGGSSGGFMTVSAMLVHPDFFKVGVAMTGPHDPSIQSAEWVERYAGVERVVGEDGVKRWEASEVASNLEIADRLQGRLLMIYGAQDGIVPLSHLHRMTNAFIKANKRVDQFVMPGTGHGLSPWRYTYGMVWTYFADHLIGDLRSGVDVFPIRETSTP